MDSIATLLNTYQSVLKEVEECTNRLSAKQCEVSELESANREYDEEAQATETNIMVLAVAIDNSIILW